MGITEDMADALAVKTIKYLDATGDEEIIMQIVKSLGESSQTAEEAFMTAIRVRRANIKAMALLDSKIKAFKEGKKTP
jgi:hypothetical protein